MTGLSVKEIREFALEIVKSTPGGIRYTSLAKKVQERSPETPLARIEASIWDLHTKFPAEVSKLTRGIFTPAGVTTPEVPDGGKFSETLFYEPFAEYLKNDLDEVDVAVPLGGTGLGGRWGTPDVVGVYRPSVRDVIKFVPEIVSAEVKTDPRVPVVAFGQAISYRLFSAKTYIVMPRTVGGEDLERLEALCMLFGVGLVLFTVDLKDPDFSIRVRAQRFQPDMYYVNKFADRLNHNHQELSEKLFGK